MKLGTETGSVINHLHARMTVGQPEPTVGMGVTFLGWSDRNPGTVQRVFKLGKYPAIECTSDSYKRTDNNGFSEQQDYDYTSNPEGHRTTWRLRNGKWEAVYLNRETGRWKVADGQRLRMGQREKYHDFSF